MPRRRFAKILGAVLAAFVLAGAGAYVLHSFRTGSGLFVGTGLVLLAVAIALPTQFSEGVAHAKELVPAIVEAVRATKKPDGGP